MEHIGKVVAASLSRETRRMLAERAGRLMDGDRAAEALPILKMLAEFSEADKTRHVRD